MQNAQRTRANGAAQSKSEDTLILDALKKASREAKRKAIADGVPFIGGKDSSANISRMHNPAHPGEILRESLPETMTLAEVAARLGVTRQSLSAVLNGRSAVSAEMAVRLSKALGTSAEFWLGLQMQYDLWRVMSKPLVKVQKLAA